MTAKQALLEVRRRLEVRRSSYTASAEQVGYGIGSERAKEGFHAMASTLSEALVIVGEVENLLVMKR